MKRTLLIVLVACGGGGSTTPPSTSPETTIVTPSGDAPEISRSVGVDGGIVILWPRVKDPALAPVAAQIQQRLADIAGRALPGRAVDVRPEPERVCARTGCKAISIGAGILQNGDACAVIALVSASGPSDQTIVPWVGDIVVKSPVAAFREPPESQVQVKDYAKCTTLVDELAAREKDIEAAIKLAAGL
ncbi:MAG: hypothetical protein M4D80_27580 [Myxococcota bacterium]|nr:hypothetical protein [Myxococcota bacterium]